MFNGFPHFGGFNTMTAITTPFTGHNGYGHAFGPFGWNGAPSEFTKDEECCPTRNNFYAGAYGFGEKATKTQAA